MPGRRRCWGDDDGNTLVEALDPAVMVKVPGAPGLVEIADEDGARLSAAVQTLATFEVS